MKRVPKLLAILFIAVTVQRVAGFAGGDILAWLFAFGLTIGVYVASYFLRWEKTRWRAALALALFAAADGLFNLSYAYEAAKIAGRWGDIIHSVAAVVFGLFPTLAAGVLGWLSAAADQIPIGGRRRSLSVREAIRAKIVEVILGSEGEFAEFANDSLSYAPGHRHSLPKCANEVPNSGTKKERIIEFAEQNPRISQKAIAETLGVSPSYVSEVLRGRRDGREGNNEKN